MVDALWRLCASSRLANHRSVFHSIKASPEQAVNFFRKMTTFSGKCQLFQENVNFFRKEYNCQEKALSTFSGKQQISVNQNQEKTVSSVTGNTRCVAVVAVVFHTNEMLKYLYIYI